LNGKKGGFTLTHRRWILVIPLLIVMLGIFYFSSQSYSEQTIRPWLAAGAMEDRLVRLLRNVHFSYNGQEISVRSMGGTNLAEFIVRKLAHIILYGALSFTMLMTAWILIPWRKAVAVSNTLVLSLIFAMFDELNQQFRDERTARLADVGIDMVGAVLGVIIFLIGYLLYTQRKENELSKAKRKQRTMRIFYGDSDT
jgi:VanZ family protein